jgi:hypothetical protein
MYWDSRQCFGPTFTGCEDYIRVLVLPHRLKLLSLMSLKALIVSFSFLSSFDSTGV